MSDSIQLRPVRLNIIPILVGFIGGASLFSAIPQVCLIQSWHWLLFLSGGLLGTIIGLKVAVDEYRDDMKNQKLIEKAIEELNKKEEQQQKEKP